MKETSSRFIGIRRPNKDLIAFQYRQLISSLEGKEMDESAPTRCPNCDTNDLISAQEKRSCQCDSCREKGLPPPPQPHYTSI